MGFVRRGATALLFASLLGSQSVAAVPEAPTLTQRDGHSSTACAKVAEYSASFAEEYPGYGHVQVPAKAAYDCLKSVPNKPGPAQKLTQSLKAFLQWQSTITWLKDPPDSYYLDAVDLLGEIDKIGEKAADGGYESEYDFAAAIYHLMLAAHDGHLWYYNDIFKVFSFQNRLMHNVVSVSVDGVSVPKLYHKEALEKAISQSDGPLTNATMPPSIVKINGENAVNLIERLLLKTSQMQDPDSQWNGAFPMYSQPGVSNPLGFSRTYMGESVTIEYDDGETATGDIVAIISDDEVDFSGIKTGEQFYQRFCNPDAPSSLLEEEEEEEAVSHTATETEHDSIGSHSSNQDSHSSPHWHNIDDETGEASSPAKDDPEAAKAGPSGHTTTKLNLSGKHGSGKHTTDDETAEASSPSKDGKRSDTSAPVARREFDIMTQVFEKRMALEKKKRKLEQTGPFWKRQGLDAIEGYPDPVARDGGADITAGYFLEGKGYEDVAVLAISGFAPTDPSLNGQFLSDFQETVSTFLAECKDQEKKKLVIDLTTNGGGFVAAGYELFSQLFPGVPKFQAHNLRETESLRRVAEITYEHMDVFEVFDPDAIDPDTMTEEEYIRAVATKILDPWMSAITSNLVPREAYSPNGTLLETMDDILGPVQIHGDNFTEYQQVPLDEISSSFNMTGVGSRASPPPAVFAPEDIVLLTDGQCGSTCTLFSYLMVLSLNVKTVVVGGRPRIGQMQSIAGVEGAQVFNMEDITATASAALLLNPKDNVTGSDLSILAEGYAVKRAMDPRQAGAINAKNSFSRADAKTPLQFLDQPANCRFFFTAEMLSSPELVWKYAADATWVDPENFCVEGSIVTKNMTQVKTDERFYNGDGEFLGADAVGRGGGGGGGGGGGDDEDPDSGAMGLFASSVAVTAFAGFAMLMALL